MKCVGPNGVKRAKKGYRAIMTATPGMVAKGRLLTGGVKEIESSVFCSKESARQWASAMRDGQNRGAAVEYRQVRSKSR